MKYSVSSIIKIDNSQSELWNLITSPGHLNLVHPFCMDNKAINWGDNEKKKDYLIYLNGIKYYREFFKWEEEKGYELWIGKKNGKKSLVKWDILNNFNELKLEITVYPYKSSKIWNSIYFLIFYIYIKPMLKSYLNSVLKGIKWYIEKKVPVSKNQFGRHSWFT